MHPVAIQVGRILIPAAVGAVVQKNVDVIGMTGKGIGNVLRVIPGVKQVTEAAKQRQEAKELEMELKRGAAAFLKAYQEDVKESKEFREQVLTKLDLSS